MKRLTRNRTLRTGVKFIFVFALLYYLGKKGFLSLDATKNAFRNWENLLVSVGCLSITTFVGILRWKVLLGAQKIHLPWGRVFRLGFVGNFFNIALPGVVSGDVVKAIYVAKESPGKRAQALSSIIFDRVAGLSGLVLISCVALLGSTLTPWGESLPGTIRLFVVITNSVVIGFYAYLFLVREKKDPLLRLLKNLEKKHKIFGSFLRVYEGIRRYHNQRWLVVYVLLLSVVIHMLVIFAFLNFSWALGVRHIPSVALYVVIPLGLLVTAIPVMPAGVGTGHAAFVALFHFLGSQRGADVFNLFLIYKIFEGSMGGLVYLKFKSKEPEDIEALIRQESELTT